MNKVFTFLVALFTTVSFASVAAQDAVQIQLEDTFQKPDYTKSKDVFRLVTYNVGAFCKYMDSMDEVALMMKEIGADAVALNELDHYNRRHDICQVEEFADALEGWNAAFYKAIWWNGGHYGNGAVTKDEIKEDYGISLKRKRGNEKRSCLVVETEEYVLAVAHLDHKSEAVSTAQAEIMTKRLKEKYGDSSKPVFLCGDFNATPESATLSSIMQDWTLISSTDYTYPSRNPRECIDYILVLKNNAKIEVVKSAVCTGFESADVTQTSDHLPVFVDVIIR